MTSEQAIAIAIWLYLNGLLWVPYVLMILVGAVWLAVAHDPES